MVEVKLNLDLASNGNTPVVDAVQNDSNSRVISANLYAGSTPWAVPEGCTVAVSYRKPDGTTGVYDTLPDSAPAVVVSKNNVRATLAAQVLTVSGDVSCAIVVTDTKTLNRVASFPIIVRVAADPGAGKPVSNDYYKYSTMEDLNNALGNVSPAIPVTMTGTAVSTDMVSPVEHEVECRVSGVDDLTAVTVYESGVNLLRNSGNAEISGVKFTTNEDGSITLSGTCSNDYCYYRFYFRKVKDINLQTGTQTFLQGCPEGGPFFLQAVAGGEYPTDRGKGAIVYRSHIEQIYIKVKNGANVDGYTFYPMLSFGTTAKPYTPYKGSILTPSPDGTVTGMKSISPSMTILTDNPGANLEVTYNADTKKYIDSKSSNVPNILTVNTTAGATVTATDGITSLKETATDGKAEFTIPEAGEWTATAEKDGESSKPVTVDVTDNFTADATIIPKAKIYGAQWDGTANTKWARTDSAVGFKDPNPAVNNGTGSSPFDSIMPWAGMTRVSDPVAGELVKIPKFYYKWTKVGNGLKLQISEKKPDGTWFTSPAHMDRGDGHGERDVVYVGRYHCGSDYKSKTGVLPKVYISRSTARDEIHALGEDIWQWDWHTRMTIWMLYLVEFADWDSQTAIGYGGGNPNETTGKSDLMNYHTGTPYGRATYGEGVQYRNIEGMWGCASDWVDGCYCDGTNLSIINSPSNFGDNGGKTVGKISYGYPKAFGIETVGGFQLIHPIESIESNDAVYGASYTCDEWATKFSPSVYVGSGDNSVSNGIGCVGCSGNYGYSSVSTRLMKLPNA